jgi:hypothetical protein
MRKNVAMRSLLRTMLLVPWLTLLSTGALSCSDEASGSGALAIRVSGEGAAKVGYPYQKNGAEIRFADDWRVTFSKYLVSVGDIKLADPDGKEAFASNEVVVTDLHLGDATVLTRENLAAKRWTRLSFRITPPGAAARTVGIVAPADLAEMQRDRLNYLIEGVAEKAGQRIKFRWGLANPTRASNCTNGVDGTEGLVIRNNATTEAEITLHLDHLFWDTLGTEVAKLRFDAIAGAANRDGEATLDELSKQQLADLRDAEGKPLVDASGNRIFYNPGSVPLSEPTLRAFMLATSAGQAHLNGTGLCTISRQ